MYTSWISTHEGATFSRTGFPYPQRYSASSRSSRFQIARWKLFSLEYIIPQINQKIPNPVANSPILINSLLDSLRWSLTLFTHVFISLSPFSFYSCLLRLLGFGTIFAVSRRIYNPRSTSLSGRHKSLDHHMQSPVLALQVKCLKKLFYLFFFHQFLSLLTKMARVHHFKW